MDRHRLAHNLLHLHAGIERTKWVLEDDLHVPAQAAKLRPAGMEHVMAVEDHLAGIGLDQPQ